MGAFIVSGSIILLTLLYCMILLGANANMPAPSVHGYDVKGPFFTGVVLAGLVAASHWIPPTGW